MIRSRACDIRGCDEQAVTVELTVDNRSLRKDLYPAHVTPIFDVMGDAEVSDLGSLTVEERRIRRLLELRVRFAASGV
jgi:hypothetical protein